MQQRKIRKSHKSLPGTSQNGSRLHLQWEFKDSRVIPAILNFKFSFGFAILILTSLNYTDIITVIWYQSVKDIKYHQSARGLVQLFQNLLPLHFALFAPVIQDTDSAFLESIHSMIDLEQNSQCWSCSVFCSYFNLHCSKPLFCYT